MMKFSLLSLVAGNEVCNARCPFCISKMTPTLGVTKEKPAVDWRNFKKAARLARQGGAQTALITGKGEPTLFPEQISEYLSALDEYEYEFVELQTNGILLMEKAERYKPYLESWYERGLTTVAISIVHYEEERNREIYTPHKSSYIDLVGLIDLLHRHSFSVRLAAVLLNGYIDSAESFKNLISFARENGVEQLSARPVNMPYDSRDPEASAWTKRHLLSDRRVAELKSVLVKEGSLLQRLPHGAEIYDLKGQNVCLTNCLTVPSQAEEIRQLIFFPNGNVTYDWQYEGAKLLRGKFAKGPERRAEGGSGRLFVLPQREAVVA